MDSKWNSISITNHNNSYEQFDVGFDCIHAIAQVILMFAFDKNAMVVIWILY